MKIVNIHSKKSKVYLFLRDDNKNLKLRVIDDYNPYYYEPLTDQTEDSKYIGYDGTKLEKITVVDPRDMRKQMSSDSFEATLHYTNKFVLDRIPEFTETFIKWAFIDIEVLTVKDEFPEASEAKYPISCISLYNNKHDKIKTWCLLDYGIEEGFWYVKDDKNLAEAELKLFIDFVSYLRKAKFDVLLAWFQNGYDWPTIYNRFSKLPQELFFDEVNNYNNFALAISPIKQIRGGSKEFNNFHPAGTSIVDYLDFFKTIYKNEKSYKLDDVMEKFLGVGKEFKEVDFTVINEIVRKRNIGDVSGWVELEKKLQLIPFFDDIRRTSMISWESLNHPLRIVEPFFLREAHKNNWVLPDKRERNIIDKVEGAYRETFKFGRFTGLSFYDLSGAYLNAVVDLCLDVKNIVDKETDNTIKVRVTDRVTQEITKNYIINQNPKALFPKVAFDLLNKKQEYKDLKKNTDINDDSYNDISKKYDTYKSIVLSSWGILLNKHFRMFSPDVASMITSTVRDLLHYTKNKLKELGMEVIYIDTDSCSVTDNGKNVCELMNEILQQWSIERFNKKSSIVFDYEGTFERILITGMCRYVGYKGGERVVKGVEIKRKDSTPLMSKFQNELFEKILDENYDEEKTKKEVIAWIKLEIERIKTVPLIDIAFPCKMANKEEDYSNIPIFSRALRYTQKILPKFKKRIGEQFYYIYVNSTEYEEKTIKEPYVNSVRLTNKPMVDLYKKYFPKTDDSIKTLKVADKRILFKKLEEEGILTYKEVKVKGILKDVLAFDKDNQEHIRDVNWNKMIERNIINKVQVVFEAMKWEMKELVITKPKRLKIDAQIKPQAMKLAIKTDRVKISMPRPVKRVSGEDVGIIIDELSGIKAVKTPIKGYYSE